MPKVTNAQLTLTKVGTNIKIDVRYDIKFTRLESNLAGLGMEFTELVQVIGVDPPGSRTGTVLHLVTAGVLPVEPINQSQVLKRAHTRTVPRATLDEDRDLLKLDADEIACRIRLLGHGLVTHPTDEFTNQVVLSDSGSVGTNN